VLLPELPGEATMSDDEQMFTLDNPLTREQRHRVAEVLHSHGIERVSFTAVQDLGGVRLEFRHATPTDFLSYCVFCDRFTYHDDNASCKACGRSSRRPVRGGG